MPSRTIFKVEGHCWLQHGRLVITCPFMMPLTWHLKVNLVCSSLADGRVKSPGRQDVLIAALVAVAPGIKALGHAAEAQGSDVMWQVSIDLLKYTVRKYHVERHHLSYGTHAFICAGGA